MPTVRQRLLLIAIISLLMPSAGIFAAEETPEEKAWEYRDGVFHVIGWKFGQMIAAKSANDSESFKQHAEDMAFMANLVTEGFELKDSIPEGSRAKEEIWEDWDDFKKRAETFDTNITALAKSGDMSAFDPKKFGSENCGNCHRKYREKK